jgi:phosphonate transport system substrate-binding protein
VKARIGLILALSLLAGACATASAGPVPFVDLSDRLPLPAEGTGEVKPLQIAVAAILSPEANIESYGELADYLGMKLERPVEIVQRRTYQEINDLLEEGQADVGFVCTSAYVAGHDDFGLRLLAAPEIDGATVYYSTLIVPADSSAESMADLRGSVFAFTDPISTTGRVYPTYLVEQLGEDTDAFFGATFFTYSHDRAIEAVAEHVADGAGVDSLVLDYALARDPELSSRIKAIDRSPAFTIPPVVVSPSITAAYEAELRNLLLSLSDDPEAGDVLRTLGIDGFISVDDAAYDGVRTVLTQVQAHDRSK